MFGQALLFILKRILLGLKKAFDGIIVFSLERVHYMSQEEIKSPTVDPQGDRTDADHLQKLLDEAMKHPGVAEALEIYSAFEKADSAHIAYRYFQSPFCDEGVSTSTEPVAS